MTSKSHQMLTPIKLEHFNNCILLTGTSSKYVIVNEL